MDLGKGVPEEALIERIRGQAPNKCCTLIYTVTEFLPYHKNASMDYQFKFHTNYIQQTNLFVVKKIS